MDSKPFLIRQAGGAGAVATALGEPSITVIEGGSALGVLVADSCHEDSHSGRLFPRPSRLPYRVLFIPRSDYEELMDRRAAGAAEAIFAYVRSRFAGLPGFRLHERRLDCPEGYAAEEGVPTNREFVSEGE